MRPAQGELSAVFCPVLPSPERPAPDLVFRSRVPAVPLRVTVTGLSLKNAEPEDGYWMFWVLWAGPKNTLLRRNFDRPIRWEINRPRRLAFYLHDRFVVGMTEGRAFQVQEHLVPYPYERIVVSSQYFAIHSIQVKELAEGEIPERARDVPRLIAQLGVKPQQSGLEKRLRSVLSGYRP
jgi:hypothetical protein